MSEYFANSFCSNCSKLAFSAINPSFQCEQEKLLSAESPTSQQWPFSLKNQPRNPKLWTPCAKRIRNIYPKIIVDLESGKRYFQICENRSTLVIFIAKKMLLLLKLHPNLGEQKSQIFPYCAQEPMMRMFALWGVTLYAHLICPIEKQLPCHNWSCCLFSALRKMINMRLWWKKIFKSAHKHWNFGVNVVANSNTA